MFLNVLEFRLMFFVSTLDTMDACSCAMRGLSRCRAAAYSKLNEHKKAIDDCQKALDIDSQYGKAYGRKGSVTLQAPISQMTANWIIKIII